MLVKVIERCRRVSHIGFRAFGCFKSFFLRGELWCDQNTPYWMLGKCTGTLLFIYVVNLILLSFFISFYFFSLKCVLT